MTSITMKKEIIIERQWFENATGEYWQEMQQCLDDRKCLYAEASDGSAHFFEPIFPLPGLIIAGAGHIGRALAHMANLLDFEVTVIDDRSEYANSHNIPDADHLVVGNIGKSLRGIVMTPDTYLVIVTRGHKDDGEALRACLDADVAYIGMIGSKRKTSLMRDEFISQGWATPQQFDNVHAPIGLEIGSKTVQEIAVSICAQLVQVRHQRQLLRKIPSVTAIILGAGESSRMGKPKLLLPFGDTTMIGTVISNVLASSVEKVIVVLGSNYEPHHQIVKDYPVEIVHNKRYRDGMFSSVQCGLKAVSNATDAIMVLLGDQPMIQTGEMDQLIESYRDSEKEIAIASHEKKRGHPILFGPKFINEILGFPKDASLRDLLQNHPAEILEMKTANDRILRDIDTENDYQFELKHHYNHD
jgi:CTP:molybdopterin cytidylyltransferase MocA